MSPGLVFSALVALSVLWAVASIVVVVAWAITTEEEDAWPTS